MFYEIGFALCLVPNDQELIVATENKQCKLFVATFSFRIDDRDLVRRAISGNAARD